MKRTSKDPQILVLILVWYRSFIQKPVKYQGMVLIGKDRYFTRPHCLLLFPFRYFRSFLIKKEPDWCCPETTGTVKGMERYRRKNQNCRSLDSNGGSAGVEALPKEVTVMGLIAGVTQKVFSCFCFCVTFLICFFFSAFISTTTF